MKVFLSWSGETSHRVAIALHRWLPYMLHHIKPFLSSSDIKKGDRWSDALAMELQNAKCSIICVTPYNVNKPWMNFEAGALSKIVGSSYVAPFLFRLDRSGLKGPLSQFQVTVCSEDEMFSLLLSLNSNLKPGKQLSHELLNRNFKNWWKHLQSEINGIESIRETETETEHDWLFSRNDIMRAEDNADYESIWIITPVPFEHALRRQAEKILIKNLEKKIRYKYIVPKSPDIKGDLEQIKRMAEPYPGLLEIKPVATACFSKQAVTDYIILNPDLNGSHLPRAFLKLPIGSEEFWVEVKDEHAIIGFRDRFKEWAEQADREETSPEPLREEITSLKQAG